MPDITGFSSSATSGEDGRELSREVLSPLPKPSPDLRPKSSSEIASAYNVSDRAFQGWFGVVCKAYSWLPIEELRTGKGNRIRYTVRCQQLIAEFREAAETMTAEDWIAAVHAANQDKLAQTQQPEVPISPTEVLPPLAECDDCSGTSGGMVAYERSDTIQQLLLSRPGITDVATPDANPVVVAIQQKVAALTQTTKGVRQELDQVRKMTADTQQAIETLEDLTVVEEAQAKADRHYRLRQQVYNQRLEELAVADVLGKPATGTAQPQSA